MKRRLIASVLSFMVCFSSVPAYAIEASVAESEIQAENAIETVAESDDSVIEADENPASDTVIEDEKTIPAVSESLKEGTDNETEKDGTEETTEEISDAEEETTPAMAASNVIDSGSCGPNLSYQLIEVAEDSYTLKITGSGNMDFGSSRYAPWDDYSYDITAVEFPDGLTGIAAYAFVDCEKLNSISLPSGLTTIGKYAFEYCHKLTSVTIPDSVVKMGYNAFACCANLETVILSDNLTEIDDSMFIWCYKLKTVHLPSDLTYIGSGAFSHTSLTSLTLSASEGLSISAGAFSGTPLTTVVIGEGLSSIGDNCFSGCSELTSITLPSTISRIGENAFQNCESLSEVHYAGTPEDWNGIGLEWGNDELLKAYYISNHIPVSDEHAFYELGDNLTASVDGNFIDGYTLTISGTGDMDGSYYWKDYESKIHTVIIESGVTSIYDSAFYGMAKLSSVSIPNTVNSIGSCAFQNCENLTSVNIPASVEIIYSYAFHGCSNLTSVQLNSGLTTIGDNAFSSCTSLKSITLPSTVTRLGRFVFSYDSSLTSVNLPSGIAEIPICTFEYCRSLSTVTIPDTVTTIGSEAFYNSGLKSIRIPNSVTEIEDTAFLYCNNLESVELPSGLTGISRSVFKGCERLQSIRIPDSVRYIGPEAFSSCVSLESICIPDGVTSIGSNAFESCVSLKSVTIPMSMQSIGGYAFYGLADLETVTYAGTVSDWNKIDIADGNNALRKAYYLSNNLTTETETYTGSCGDHVTYTLTGEFVHGYDLSIQGTGPMEDFNRIGYEDDVYDPWGEFREEIKSVTIGNGITYIGAYAFSGNMETGNRIERVIIPSTVTSIGRNAFWNCTRLQSITIPKSVTFIGYAAFSGCNNLRTLNYNGTEAEWKAIDRNTALNDENDVLDAAYNMTNGTLPSGQCGDNAWYSMTGDPSNGYTLMISGTGEMWARMMQYDADWSYYPIKHVVIENGITTVGPYSFIGLKMETVTIPESVTEIWEWGFSNCNKIQSIEFPQGLTTIGMNAFRSCTGLKEIVIPRETTLIGEGAFYKSGITDVYYPGSESDWKELISKSEDFGLETATIHYNYIDDPEAFVIIQQPQNVTAGLNAKISFQVKAQNAAAYQWQYSKDGVKWYNSSSTSAKTDTISITVSKSNYQNVYRCKVTGTDGSNLLSDNAGIDMIPWVNVIQQPESPAMIVGETVNFHVDAENVAAYQWQYSKDGKSWFKSGATGCTTDTLSIKVSSTNLSNMYRCQMTGIDGNKSNSNPAVFVIIAEQPQPSTAKVGEYATFSLQAEGVTAYQWQYSDNGTKWYTSTASGATTGEIRFKATSTNAKRVYRCRLTTVKGDETIYAYTKPVGFAERPEITRQPVDVTAAIGAKASFTVEATGVTAYQWQYSKDGKTWYKSSATGNATKTLTITKSDSNKNNVYRCKLTGNDGSVMYTNAVMVK